MNTYVRLSLALLASTALCGCQSLSAYRDRHPVLTTLAITALVGGLAWNASTDYSRYWVPGKPCKHPDACR